MLNITPLLAPLALISCRCCSTVSDCIAKLVQPGAFITDRYRVGVLSTHGKQKRVTRPLHATQKTGHGRGHAFHSRRTLLEFSTLRRILNHDVVADCRRSPAYGSNQRKRFRSDTRGRNTQRHSLLRQRNSGEGDRTQHQPREERVT